MNNEGSKFWKTCSDYFKNHSNVTFYLRYVPGSFDHEFIHFMEFIKLKNFLCLEFATYPLHLELEHNIQESEKALFIKVIFNPSPTNITFKDKRYKWSAIFLPETWLHGGTTEFF